MTGRRSSRSWQPVAHPAAPSGRFQRRQPNLPHRGFAPFRAGQADWELDVSHWTQPLAQLEVHADWAFDGAAHDLFGRLLYNGAPVHGVHTWKAQDPAKAAFERQMKSRQLQLSAGDRFCPTQT